MTYECEKRIEEFEKDDLDEVNEFLVRHTSLRLVKDIHSDEWWLLRKTSDDADEISPQLRTEPAIDLDAPIPGGRPRRRDFND